MMKSTTFKTEFLWETVRRNTLTLMAITALGILLAMASSCDKTTMEGLSDLEKCLSDPNCEPGELH